MKKEDVLLENTEMLNHIQRVVCFAGENGINRTNLKSVIDKVWKETYSSTEVVFTKEEKTFLEKVEAFINYYDVDIMNARNGFILAHDDPENYMELQNVKRILVTLFILREKGLDINETYIKRMSRNTFGVSVKTEMYGFGLKVTLNFFFNHLGFESENEKPVFESEYCHNKKAIFEMPGFKAFSQQYKSANARSWAETSNMAIWVIETYF